MIVCSECGATNPDGSRLCTECSTMLAAAAAPAAPQMPLPAQRQTWQQAPAPFSPQAPPPPDPLGGLIPYRNGPALTSYYLGLFSGIPLIGVGLAIAAWVLGVRGLALVKENPAARGRTHAIVGLVTGTIGGLFNLLILSLIAMALLSERHRDG